MAKVWIDPVKQKQPRPSTLAIEGDFGKFTEFMKKLVAVKPSQKKASSDPGPAAS